MKLIQDNEEKKGKFITVSGGRLKIKVDEKTPGAKSRLNMKGEFVWEVTFKGIEGARITSASIQEGQYGNQIFIGLSDSEETNTLVIKEESSYGRAFYGAFHKIDLTKTITIKPYDFINAEGKKFVGITFEQGGVKIEKTFPEGTPAVESKEIGGKWIYNQIQMAERAEFLRARLNKWVSDNNLHTPDVSEVMNNPNVDTTPLSAEEIKELSKLKKSNKGKELTGDNFFDEA